MYSLFCTDENGFSYYDTIEVGDAVELADVWDIVTSMGDMWMEKNRSTCGCSCKAKCVYIKKDYRDKCKPGKWGKPGSRYR